MHPHPWFKRHWIALCALLLLSSCKQIGNTKPDLRVPEVSYTNETALVSQGLSSQAAFSPKGDRLIFVSAKRPGHTQAQVYEKDLSTGEETRITFQNGDVSHPVYHPKENYILYSSSTDELKENPPLLRSSSAHSILPLALQEPVELYLHELHGLEIRRLTESSGFDGDASFSPDGKTIYFTHAQEKKIETLALRGGSKQAQVVQKLGANSSSYRVSPDGKWQAWIEWDAAFESTNCVYNKAKKDAIELTPDAVVTKTDVEFSPDSKWLFWSQWDTVTSTFHLWSFEMEKACARKVLGDKDLDRRHPMLSPDLQRLVYTAGSKVQSRIMQVGFTAPSGPCAGAP